MVYIHHMRLIQAVYVVKTAHYSSRVKPEILM